MLIEVVFFFFFQVLESKDTDATSKMKGTDETESF